MEFCKRAGLFKFPLDRSASSGGTPSCDLSGSTPHYAAPRLAAVLMEEVIAYAQSHHLMVSLETHNPANVPMYEHFGFKIFGIVQKNFDLKQYCMIREFR